MNNKKVQLNSIRNLIRNQKQYFLLEEEREKRLGSFAISIQRVYRGFYKRNQFKKMKQAAIQLEAACKVVLCKKQLHLLRQEREKQLSQAAVLLQTAVRKQAAQKMLSDLKTEKQQRQLATLCLQTGIRAYFAIQQLAQLKEQKRQRLEEEAR